MFTKKFHILFSVSNVIIMNGIGKIKDYRYGIEKAILYLEKTQNHDGSWSGPLSSRLFESSIVFLVLSSSNKMQKNDPSIKKLYKFIQGSNPADYHDVAKIWEKALKHAAMKQGGGVNLMKEILFDPIYFRKTLIVYTLLRVSGVRVTVPDHPNFTLSRLRNYLDGRPNIKEWSFVDMMICYILLCFLEKKTVAPEMVTLLKEKQLSNGSWFHNPITSSIAGLALYLNGEEASFLKALNYLKSIQQKDGGISYCEIPIWDTALNLLGLPKNFRNSFVASAVQYLLKARNNDGGWGFYPALESENDTTAIVTQALRYHDLPDYLNGTISYFCGNQMPNGLWPVWRSSETPSVEVVAHIITALNSWPNLQLDLSSAKSWLVHSLQTNGLWSAEWSINIPYSVFAVLESLTDQAADYEAVITKMLALQNLDGGFSLNFNRAASCPSATANAILALGLYGHRYRDQILSGVNYLAQNINSEGTWHSVKEVLGPRPLLYSIQASTHAFCLRALTFAEKFFESYEDKT